MSVLIALVAIAFAWWWLTKSKSPKRKSQWKRVRGFTQLCQRAPGESKAEALALLELRKAPWKGKVAAVEKALYHLDKDRR